MDGESLRASRPILVSIMPVTAAPVRDVKEGATVKCFHCGTPCRDRSFASGDKAFCCHGCLTVFELLSDNGLSNFYELSDTAGVRFCLRSNVRGWGVPRVGMVLM